MARQKGCGVPSQKIVCRKLSCVSRIACLESVSCFCLPKSDMGYGLTPHTAKEEDMYHELPESQQLESPRCRVSCFYCGPSSCQGPKPQHLERLRLKLSNPKLASSKSSLPKAPSSKSARRCFPKLPGSRGPANRKK